MSHVGLFLPPFGELADASVLAELANEAEEAGWDGVFLWDHVDYRAPVTDVADPWIALAAMAVATERVRLGALVTPLARRRPQVVARQVATLAHLSSGRLVLGAGLGLDGSGRELSAFGEETDDRTRAAMLDEALDLVGALLGGEEVRHRGEHYVADGVRFRPAADVPVWVGARWPHRRPLRRAARHDGVFVIDLEGPDLVPDVVAAVGGVDVVCEDRDAATAPDYLAAGAAWWLHAFDPFTVTRKTVEDAIQSRP